MKKLSLLALVGVLLLSAAPVPADDGFYVIAGRYTPGTKITSLPYTIDMPGYYYLTGNLTSPGGNGITVNADNVTIDLMGFVLSGPPVGFYDGISITGSNVEVRNGTVRNWFRGVYATGSRCRAINIRAAENISIGIILGADALIQGCTASPRGSNAGQGLIITSGTISGCTVMDFSPTESTTPQIYLSSGGRASDNLVLNCTGTGIKVLGSATVKGNAVINCTNGIDMSGGGSLIANVVRANSGQTALIFGSSGPIPVVADQNSCYLSLPDATHYSGTFLGWWGLHAYSH